MHKRSHTKTPSLLTATSLDEAVNILEKRNAPGIYKKHVNLAFNLKNDSDNKIRKQMLSECEMELQTEEKKKMDENIKTEGGESHEGTAQSDGRELDDITETPESGEGSTPAQGQSGSSQLDAALSEAINQAGPADDMNTAIIDYMNDGMSQVEAQNAVTSDTKLSEAVFSKQFNEVIVPVIKAIIKENKTLRETIIKTDSKVEVGRKENATHGMSEGIQQVQTIDSGYVPKYDSNPEIISEKQDNIRAKYLD